VKEYSLREEMHQPARSSPRTSLTLLSRDHLFLLLELLTFKMTPISKKNLNFLRERQ
jgi:hypothetical protein